MGETFLGNFLIFRGMCGIPFAIAVSGASSTHRIDSLICFGKFCRHFGNELQRGLGCEQTL
jgi:hypothetical protein